MVWFLLVCTVIVTGDHWCPSYSWNRICLESPCQLCVYTVQLNDTKIMLVQWNLDITVTLGTVLPGCYTLGDLLMQSKLSKDRQCMNDFSTTDTDHVHAMDNNLVSINYTIYEYKTYHVPGSLRVSS